MWLEKDVNSMFALSIICTNYASSFGDIGMDTFELYQRLLGIFVRFGGESKELLKRMEGLLIESTNRLLLLSP